MSLRTDVLLWAQRVIARKGQPPHVLLEIRETSTAEEIQDAFHKIARNSHPDLHRHGLDANELELVTSAYATVAGAYQQMRTAAMRTQRSAPIKQDSSCGPGDARSNTPPGVPRTMTQTPPSGMPRTMTQTPPSGMPPGMPRTMTQTPPPGMPRTMTQTPASGARTVQPATATQTTPAVTRAAQPSPPAGSPVTRPGTPPPDSGPSTVPIAGASNAAQAMSAKALLYYRKAETCLKRGDLKGAVLQIKLACAADPTSAFLRTALAEVETEIRKAT